MNWINSIYDYQLLFMKPDVKEICQNESNVTLPTIYLFFSLENIIIFTRKFMFSCNEHIATFTWTNK